MRPPDRRRGLRRRSRPGRVPTPPGPGRGPRAVLAPWSAATDRSAPGRRRGWPASIGREHGHGATQDTKGDGRLGDDLAIEVDGLSARGADLEGLPTLGAHLAPRAVKA